jgi:uncharacterized protein YlxP (DUF503 family)
MFVCIARLALDIPGASSLKAKRQVVRRVADKLKAKFNVAVAEIDDSNVWTREVLGLSLVGNGQQAVQEQMEKVLNTIEEMYVATVGNKEIEVVAFEDLFSEAVGDLAIPRGERSLAEAEGMGAWEDRHGHPVSAGLASLAGKPKKALSLDERRAAARALRKPREWEK